MLVTAAPLSAQDAPRGSRNLPVDHWAYEYIRRLRTRGYLDHLSPLAAPYRRAEVARGVTELDPDTLPEPVAGWVRLLRGELRRELNRLAGRPVTAWGVPISAALVASTGQRLDVLRPAGDGDAWPHTTAGTWVERGPFAAEARLALEEQLEDDPDGPVDQGRFGRTDNAYLSVALPFADIWFGRFKQNWAALGTSGRVISDNPPAYNQLAYEIRVGPFALRSLTGELETLSSSAFPEGLKRYVAAHRFEFRSRHAVFVLGNGALFATQRGLQLRFLNPLEGVLLESTNRAPGAPDDVVGNSLVEALSWVGGNGMEGYLEFMVDDLDVDPGPEGAEPFTYAFTVGARFANLVPWLELAVEYGQVSAFAYRAPPGVDVWSYINRGLGDNFADFDRFTLTADVFTPLPGLRLTPTFQVQRQGEGDFRIPVPPREIHVQSPALFLGIVETTVRLGLRGRYQPNRYVFLQWDVGENVVRDAGHVAGRDLSDFSATVQAGATVDLRIR